MHRYCTGEDLHPRHVFAGLWEGIVGEAAFSLAEGVAGIIYLPAKGIYVDGADGFYVSF